MGSISRHRESHDEGFTLVELVVALAILAVGIVGVIGVTNSSFRVAGATSAKSKMVAIATKEIEALRAIPYNNIVDGYTDEMRTSNGVPYRLQRTIGPAPDMITSDGLPADKHRQAIVSVTWKDQGGAHEVHQASFIYPGGIGLANAGSTTTVVSNCTPEAPSSLTASQVVDGTLLQATNSLDLQWTASTTGCPISAYVIQYKQVTAAAFSEVTRLATSREFRVTGLTAATTYQFQVLARGPSGRLSTASPLVSASTASAVGDNCTLGTITLTPPGVKKQNGSGTANLESGPVLAMPVNGTCPAFDVVYKKTSTSAASTQPMTLTSGTHVVTISATGPWDVGSRFIDVVERSSRLKVGSVLFVVCEHNTRECA